MATLTKAQLVEELLAENIFTKGESTQVVETIFELIEKSLEAGDDVLVSESGKLCMRCGRHSGT